MEDRLATHTPTTPNTVRQGDKETGATVRQGDAAVVASLVSDLAGALARDENIVAVLDHAVTTLEGPQLDRRGAKRSMVSRVRADQGVGSLEGEQVRGRGEMGRGEQAGDGLKLHRGVSLKACFASSRNVSEQEVQVGEEGKKRRKGDLALGTRHTRDFGGQKPFFNPDLQAPLCSLAVEEDAGGRLFSLTDRGCPGRWPPARLIWLI